MHPEECISRHAKRNIANDFFILVIDHSKQMQFSYLEIWFIVVVIVICSVPLVFMTVLCVARSYWVNE